MLALAAAALTALLALAVFALVSISPTHGSSPGTSPLASSGPESGFDGAVFPASTGAPNFTLSDQYGRRTSLSDYRGQVVVLTFLYSTCGDTCIVIAEQIRGALDELEAEHARLPAVVIVSADPAADTPASIGRFLSQVSLSGRVQYLSGPVSRLREIWRAWQVKPASVGASEFDEYAPVFVLDPSGHKRALFEAEELTPEGLSHDIGKLDGDPTDR